MYKTPQTQKPQSFRIEAFDLKGSPNRTRTIKKELKEVTANFEMHQKSGKLCLVKANEAVFRPLKIEQAKD
jgi:hypothetical protein